MKKAFKIVALLLFAGFLLIQFVRPDRVNPPVNSAETLEASTAVPGKVGLVLRRSCMDCHSNETVYPWYSNISPVSWFLAGHIRDGRAELNFSGWNTYSMQKKMRKLDDICDQVQDGHMPLPSYLWIHRRAVLTEDDKKTLCDWTTAEKARIGD